MVCLSLVTSPSVAGRKVSVKNAMRKWPSLTVPDGTAVGYLDEHRSDLLQVRHDGLGELIGPRAATEVFGTGLGALQGLLYPGQHPLGLVIVTEVDQHVLRREQGRERVCAVLSRVLRGRTVHRLEDRDLLTNIRPGSDTKAAGKTRAQVRQNIAVEVRADEHVVEVRLHGELHAHVVHDAVVYLLEVVFVVLGDLEEHVPEETVGKLHDVGLVDHGDVFATLFFGSFEGHATDTLGALAGDDLDRLRRVFADGVFHAGVEVLGVLAVDHDVDVLVRRLYARQAQGWPDVPVEVELLTQRHVHGPEPRPYRCGQRPLNGYLVALDRLEH